MAQFRDDAAYFLEARVVVGQPVVGHAADLAVHHGAPQFLRIDFLPDRGFDEKRPGEVNAARLLYDQRLIAHDR